jgi:hypothetical protein
MPRALVGTSSGAFSPPIAVRTQPGCIASTVMRRPRCAAAKLRASEFSAALLARYSA